jgi:hypothetical protein
MRRVLLDVSWDYTVEEDEHGELWLCVVCGSIGVYEVTVKLDAEAAAAFRERGPDALRPWIERARAAR